MDFANTVLLAFIAFAGANITDLFVLVLFFSKPRFRPKQIVLGQYLGVGLLIVVCLIAALGVLTVIPEGWIKFLGVIPILVGLKNLLELRNEETEDVDLSGKSKLLGGNTLEVASVAFADCSDNLAIFIPLLIGNTTEQKTITVSTFLVLIGVWCAAAYYLTRHKQAGFYVKKYGRILAPFVLMALGIAILIQ